jgi:hypothetical protein|nr:MAG TPA: hypothetical protein [Caudoviricetes sp.]
MEIHYVGKKAFRQRLAEFTYDDKEEDRFFAIANAMEVKGWNIDVGVQNWAAIEVVDRNEYEEVKSDWIDLKKAIK